MYSAIASTAAPSAILWGQELGKSPAISVAEDNGACAAADKRRLERSCKLEKDIPIHTRTEVPQQSALCVPLF